MVVPDRHPVLLDALLLAAQNVRRPLPFSPENLPLATVTGHTWPTGQFVWLASALAVQWTGPATDRFITRNAMTTDTLNDTSSHGGKVADAARGLSKVTRKRIQLRCAVAATAWCVGDRGAVEDLMRNIHAIGAQRRQGFGELRSVSITTDESARKRAWWRPLPGPHPDDQYGATGRFMAPGRATPPYWDREMAISAWWPREGQGNIIKLDSLHP